MVDVSAKARVFGMATQFVNLRGGAALKLPQRIAVLAQGSTSAVFSTAKAVATSAAEVGNRAGWGSPAHLIADQLLPANGDGVGTIPVTFYLLADDGSATAAVGDITPSGTATKSQAWQVSVSGILSNSFVIPAGAIVVNDVLRKMYDAIVGVLKMPVKPTFTYGTVTASALVGTGNGTLTALAVHSGSVARPGAYTLKLKTAVVNGGVWTLRDPDGVIVADDLTQTVGVGSITVFSDKAGLDFTITDGTTDFGLNATFTITVPATKIVLTSKWKGASANAITLSMVGDTTLGVSYGITQPTGGLVNPSVAAALAQFGGSWETMVLNAMNITDTATLDLIRDFGVGRWNELVRKPFVAFCGNTDVAVATASAVPAARADDYINSELPAPGSVNLPFVVAARQLARIAVTANENPPTDYGALQLTGITPGTDAQQWDYVTKDLALKAGCSSVDLVDNVLRIADVVTFYHPTGEEDPAFRYVVDIVKLQNIMYNIGLPFAQPEWAGAPLVPDSQVVTNEKARQPKHVIAVVAGAVDGLGKAAILSDPATAKKSIKAAITGPKRIDFEVTVQLSGNTNVKSALLRFGFYFGLAA
jgi:phage tail sheath gpL-like